MTFVCSECGHDRPAGGRCPRDGAALVDSRDDPLIGQIIGSYRVIARIGEGGMGSVYKALHPQIGSRVAIKVLAPELALGDESIGRFFAEARAANLIRHEGIVNVIDMGQLPDGGPYMLMELLEGETFADCIEARGPVPVGRGVEILAAVLDALEAAHRIGVIHRDIKPHNVFITTAGRVKLLDFGVAKLRAPDVSRRGGDFSQLVSIATTAAGVLVGTPYYCSPEQALQLPIDARSDVYAVGVMAYEAFTGRHPFEADTLFELLQKHVEEVPLPPRHHRPDLPLALEQIVLRALAKDPDERYPSAQAMRDALMGAPSPSEADTVPSVASDTLSAPPPFSVDSAALHPPSPPTAHSTVSPPVLAAAVFPAAATQVSPGGAVNPRRGSARAAVASLVVAALVTGAGVGVWQAFEGASSAQHDEEDDEKRPTQKKKKPSLPGASERPPGASDLSRFDPSGELEGVIAWARERDPSAELVMLHVVGVDERGRVDLTSNTRMAAYHFTTSAGCLVASFNFGGAAAITGDLAMCGGKGPVPPPRCRAAQLIARGNLGGEVTVSYMILRDGGRPEWTVSSLATTPPAHQIYADDC